MSTIVSYLITEIINSKLTHQHGVQQIDVLKYELITKFTKKLLKSNKDIKLDDYTIEIITEFLNKDLYSIMCYYDNWYKFNIKAVDIYNKIQEVKEKGLEILNIKYNNYADDYIDKSITNDSGLVKVNDVYSIRVYSNKQKNLPYGYVHINQYIDVYENNVKIIHSLFEACGENDYSNGFIYIDSDNDFNMFKYFKQLKKIEDIPLLNKAEEEEEKEEEEKEEKEEEEEEEDEEEEEEDEEEEDKDINWLPINNNTSDYYNFSDELNRFDYKDRHYYNTDNNDYDHDDYDNDEEDYKLSENSNTIIGAILNKIQQKLYMYEWCDDVVLYFKLSLNENIFISNTLKPIKPLQWNLRYSKKSEHISEYDKFESVVSPKLRKLKK